MQHRGSCGPPASAAQLREAGTFRSAESEGETIPATSGQRRAASARVGERPAWAPRRRREGRAWQVGSAGFPGLPAGGWRGEAWASAAAPRVRPPSASPHSQAGWGGCQARARCSTGSLGSVVFPGGRQLPGLLRVWDALCRAGVHPAAPGGRGGGGPGRAGGPASRESGADLALCHSSILHLLSTHCVPGILPGLAE